MAGMYSLLHKSQLRLEANASAGAAEDGTNDFRSAPASRSPMPGRRILGIGQVHMKTMTGQSDRLPKRFRKRRCHEIHPVLRRSVCTLLLAVLGIMAGFVIILIDHYKLQSISTTGLIVLCAAIAFGILGVAWFFWSLSQLKKLKKRSQEIKAERENSQEKINQAQMYSWSQQVACDPAALSASKWPVRRPADENEKCEFRCKVTTPNGREIGHFPSYRTPVRAVASSCRRESDSSLTSDGSSDGSVFANEIIPPRSRTHTPEIVMRSDSIPALYRAGAGADSGSVQPEIFVTNCVEGQLRNDEAKRLREKGFEMVKVIQKHNSESAC